MLKTDKIKFTETMDRKTFLKMGCAAACGIALNPGLFAQVKTPQLNKWTKEAMYYTMQGTTAICELCPHECLIRPGKVGDCRTRENIDGKLYTIAYGNPCAVHNDPIEKKPLYHFLPTTRSFSIATAGCTFRCLNCQNWTISQKSPRETKNYDLMPEAVVKACQRYGCESISYTYSEPTAWYEYMYDTAKLARKEGIKNVLVSCGHIKEKPLRKLCKLTDAANIDLKGFDKEIHKKLNGGSLESVKRTLEVCSEEKVWLEITNLVIPNWTDDMPMIKKMCKWLVAAGLGKYPLHFSRFYPQYKLDNIPPTPVSTLETARKTALDAGVEHVYIGNVPGTAASNTYCPKCGKLLIERKGFYILKNEIKNGKCSCGKEISGVWK